jgi:hypothetical protein
MRRYARIGWMVTVLMVLALGAQPASGSEGKHKPRPDLYVRSAELLPIEEDHALRGEDNILKFDALTQNRGKGAAKPSKTEIVFIPNTDAPTSVKPIHAFSLDVPRIRGFSPDKYYSHSGTAKSPPLTFNDYPLGTYQAYWCADAENKVKESNERNNCVVPGGVLQRLFLGKRRWTGTVTGTGPVGKAPTSAREDWSSGDAALVLERVSGGTFYYQFEGTVSWAMNGGSDANHCSYTGSGTDSIQPGPPNGELQMVYTDDYYGGTFYSDTADTYPVAVRCPTETIDELGPFYGLFLTTLDDGNTRPLPFGTEVLADTEADVYGMGTWTWAFH